MERLFASNHRLTSNAPLSAVLFVDPGDDRSDDEPRHIPTCIEQSDLGTVRVTEIGVPGVHSLKTGDDGAVI